MIVGVKLLREGRLVLNRKLQIYLYHWKQYFLSVLRPQKYGSKIFCIGYNKTGTTSLGKALTLLGYRHSSFNRIVWRKLYLKGKIDAVIRYTSKFNSFDDLPWLKEDLIPVLDKRFPGSKWIYLERDEESWKRSCKAWSSGKGWECDAEEGWRGYCAHHKFVMDYFKDRMEDLLVLKISDPKGFQKLGVFLGRPVPANAFPVYNRS